MLVAKIKYTITLEKKIPHPLKDILVGDKIS